MKPMNKLCKYTFSILLAMGCGAASAQELNSAYFTEGYSFRHDLNPAYGNERNYVSIPALGNIQVKTLGNFGYKSLVLDNPMYPSESGKSKTSFLNPYISTDKALEGFNKGKNRIAGDVKITLLSAGFKAFNGYNTVELNARTSFGANLPYTLFEFAKNTGNQTYHIGDIQSNAQAFAELAFGHSRQVNEKLRVGGKVKLLFGIGRADVKISDFKADLASANQWVLSGKAQANVSMKNFKYLEKEKEYHDTSLGKYSYVNDIDMDGAGLNGMGVAFDLGAVYKINEDWTVSAAVLDLGFINWKNNHQATNKKDQFLFKGFHDTSISSDQGNTADDQLDNYEDQIAQFINVSDDGDQGKRLTGIGATVNVGCEYVFPLYRKLKFGALSSTRINGTYTWTEGRLSANVAPLKWIDSGISVGVNNYTTSFGWIVNFHPKFANIFIGMDHLLGKTSKEMIPLSSNASLNIGFNVTW